MSPIKLLGLVVMAFLCGLIFPNNTARSTCAVNSPPDGGGTWCCLGGGEWEDEWPVGSGPPVTAVTLYLHDSITIEADCVDNPPCDGYPSAQVIANTINAELNQYREYTRMNIAVNATASVLHDPLLDFKYGAIKLIKAAPPDGSNGGYASLRDVYPAGAPNGKNDGCLIYINSGYSPDGILLHEVTHCLGLGHPNMCGADRISLMGGERIMRRYDIGFLERTYGTRVTETPYAALSTNVGASWTTSTLASGTMPSRGISACNGSRQGKRFAVARGDETLWWWQDGLSATQLVSASTPYRPGVGCASYTSELIAWNDDDNAGNTSSPGDAFHFREWINGTEQPELVRTWPAYGAEWGAAMSVAYDPASARYVYAFQANGGALEIHTKTGYLGHTGAGQLIDITGPPSIACGPVSVVGTDNCIVTYAKGWGPTLHWFVGHVDVTSDQFIVNASSMLYDGYTVFGGPSVAYSGNVTNPWLVSFHQGSTVIYEFKKSATVSADWTYQGFYQVAPTTPFPGPTATQASWCIADAKNGSCTSLATRIEKLGGAGVER